MYEQCDGQVMKDPILSGSRAGSFFKLKPPPSRRTQQALLPTVSFLCTVLEILSLMVQNYALYGCSLRNGKLECLYEPSSTVRTGTKLDIRKREARVTAGEAGPFAAYPTLSGGISLLVARLQEVGAWVKASEGRVTKLLEGLAKSVPKSTHFLETWFGSGCLLPGTEMNAPGRIFCKVRLSILVIGMCHIVRKSTHRDGMMSPSTKNIMSMHRRRKYSGNDLCEGELTDNWNQFLPQSSQNDRPGRPTTSSFPRSKGNAATAFSISSSLSSGQNLYKFDGLPCTHPSSPGKGGPFYGVLDVSVGTYFPLAAFNAILIVRDEVLMSRRPLVRRDSSPSPSNSVHYYQRYPIAIVLVSSMLFVRLRGNIHTELRALIRVRQYHASRNVIVLSGAF
ncbi:hypothetical protein DFS33DRAFT_1274522 [Desarmillaria ectypa]|nr:hypothetical protein DFS33DRAFT_1274522 [Desarmillaria ectypa]